MSIKLYLSKYVPGRFCLRYFLIAIFLMALPQLSFGEMDDASSSSEGSAALGQLGSIEFPASGSRDAHPHFLRGVAALHSFWYEEAIEAFRRATTIDPNFVMGYWGEAMANNHPVWQEENVEAARAALGKVSDTAPATVRERQYLQAVNTLFGEGDKLARDQAYAARMESLASKYP
ncbi:MAG: tetratricopeptide repeat protein, partial [Nitrospirales bacterium]